MNSASPVVVPVESPIGNGWQLARPQYVANSILVAWAKQAERHKHQRMLVIMRENRRDQAILSSRR
jgi:hypothetical protein